MNNFFIIGMRRSGTSIFRNLVSKHPKVKKILFEPHHLHFAIKVSFLSRYKSDKYVKNTLNNFRNAPKWTGAKFVYNAGIEALNWRKVSKRFPDSKYIFIYRNPEETYKSWIKLDKNTIRGICEKDLYMGFFNKITNSFKDFVKNNTKNSTWIDYKELVLNTDKEIDKVWKLLDIKSIKGLDNYIHKPKNWSNK